MSIWKHWLAAWACCGMLVSPLGPRVKADEPAAAAAAAPATSDAPRQSAPLDVSYIPASAAVAVVLHPQPLLTGPNAEWMPVEVITAAGMQQFGIDPAQIREAVVVVNMPQSLRGQPEFGVVLRFSQPYSAEALIAKLPLKEANAEGKQIYEMTRPEKLSVYLPDDRTIVLSPERAMLGQMLAAKDVDSPLVKLLRTTDCSATLTEVVSVDSMRGFIDQALAQAPPLQPPLADFLKVPKLTSALVERLDLAGEARFDLTLQAVDEPSAKELLGLVQQGLLLGRQAVLAQLMHGRPAEDDPVQQAGMKYTVRLVNHLFDLVHPVQAGQDVSVSLRFESSVAVVGILIGLLLPAVQKAREAARRVQSMNNMKQIGLAMFSFETTNQHFPPRAIFDKQGKPLLSWRVAILPYLDQEALYKQFHLDEPWDSPHNKPLSATVVPVYANPELPPSSKTNYLVPVGPGLMFEGTKGRSIAEVTDGLSQTILLVEANADKAVEWAKPDDWEVDLNRPLEGVGRFNPGGILTVFCDGSVQRLPSDIKPDVIKALLTIAGGEAIDQNQINAR